MRQVEELYHVVRPITEMESLEDFIQLVCYAEMTFVYYNQGYLFCLTLDQEVLDRSETIEVLFLLKEITYVKCSLEDTTRYIKYGEDKHTAHMMEHAPDDITGKVKYVVVCRKIDYVIKRAIDAIKQEEH